MPIIVAFFVRQLIVIGVQLGIFAMVEKYITPLLNTAIEEIMEFFGVAEEEAKDILANEVITTAESIGITVLLSKAKLPLKIAEKLGFTSKGFKKRPLTSSTQEKITKTTKTPLRGVPTTAEDIGLLAKTAAKIRGMSASQVSLVITLMLSIAQFPFIVLMALSNAIDFGNWNSGAYQKTMQKVFSVITFGLLTPDPKVPKSSVLSSDVWTRAYATYRELGAVGINDPFKLQTVLFSRQNLIDVVDKIAALAVADGQAIGLKQIIAATTAIVILKPGQIGMETSATGTTRQPIIPVKVFTGIVSQGTLGAPTEFTPRENDLIESVDELKDSAQNNLAPFITALPGKIIYEIKIVSSVTTKDGFRRTGEAQKVLSKYTAAGVPLYRTIVNKFAVLDIFIMTDKNTKSKISSIVLGPTDAVKLQPKTNELKNIETSIKQDLFTSNISDITGIQTAQPITITTPPIQPAETIITPAPVSAKPQYKVTNEMYISRDGFDGYLYKATPEQLYQFVPREVLFTDDEKKQFSNFGASFDPTKRRLLEYGVNIDAMQRVQFFDTLPSRITSPQKAINSLAEFFGPAMSAPVLVSAKPASSTCLLQTLYEWYTAQGKSLPSIGQRATLYESLGLGLSAYYVGTGEQNAKLLTALKRNNGCNI